MAKSVYFDTLICKSKVMIDVKLRLYLESTTSST